MKFFLGILAVMSSTLIFAQIEKGAFLLSGDIGIQMNNYEEVFSGRVYYSEESNAFVFNPKAGFFVSSNVALGIGFGILNTERVIVENFNPSFPDLERGTKISKRYFNPFMNFQSNLTEKLKFNFIAESKIGIGEAEYSVSGGNTTNSEINFFELNLSPGLFYFLSPKTALTLNYGNLSYVSQTETIEPSSGNDSNIKTNDIGFNFGVESLKVGFAFIFNKKS